MHSRDLRPHFGKDLCITGWVYEYDLIKDDREAIRRQLRDQIEFGARTGRFILGTPYLTGEVDPETIDFMCEEAVRLYNAN